MAKPLKDEKDKWYLYRWKVDKAELKKGLTSYMRGLQRRPAKVRAFFQAPTVRYAA